MRFGRSETQRGRSPNTSRRSRCPSASADAKLAFDGPADDVALVKRRRWVIADREDVLPSDGDASDVVLPLDELLQDHRLRPVPRRETPGLVVGPDQLVLRVDAIDVLPSAAGVRLQDRG